MPIDHDQIFKRLIEAFFREFMEMFCPAVARLIDFAKVDFLREEHFTDTRRGIRRRMDLVAKVGLKAGGKKFVLVHGEFEASRKEQNFARRMFKYFCQLFLRYDTQIVPIALFTDDAQWRAPAMDHFELSLAARTFARFEFYLIKLKHLDYRQFLDSNNPLAYALMAKMDYNRKQRVRLKADFLRLVLSSPTDPARQSLLIEFVETYLPLAGPEQTEFQQIVRSDEKYVEVKQMITTYEKKGEKKGERKGKQEALILLLERKFGKLSPAMRRKMREIESTGRLESLLLAVLDAATLEELPL